MGRWIVAPYGEECQIDSGQSEYEKMSHGPFIERQIFNVVNNSRGLTAPGGKTRNSNTFRGLLAPGYCDNRFLRVNKPPSVPTRSMGTRKQWKKRGLDYF